MNIKRILFMFVAMYLSVIQAIAAPADSSVNINLTDLAGVMIPKVGWLLAPNENTPDGRIIPLNTRIVRDDMDYQNILSNHSINWGNVTARQDIVGDIENTRLARMKTASNRLSSMGISLYPIFAYLPTWASTNGTSVAPVRDFDAWAQWVRDIAQYIKDNRLPITECNIYNENWQIGVPDYNRMHVLAWHAFKEILPDVRLGGPSPDHPSFNNVQSLIDYSVRAGITLDIIAWHFSVPDGIASFQKQLSDYMAKFPQLGQPKYYHEEWGNHIYESGDFLAHIAANDAATAVDETVLAIWHYSNGLSDMLISNPSADYLTHRRKTWWLMAAYGNMSGQRVKKTGNVPWVASVDREKGEAKVMVTAQNAGIMDFTLDNPFPKSNLRIEKYRIVGTKIDGSADTGQENEGIKFQSAELVSKSGNMLTVSINFAPQDVWMIVVKKIKSIPSDFMLISPDDNAVAPLTPTFTWQKAQGADSYTLTVSKNKNLSNPVYTRKRIAGESFTLDTPLNLDERYYWSVTANNAHGNRPALNSVYYTFTVKSNMNVPGAFTMFQICDENFLTPLKPHVSWSKAKGATKYHIYISQSADFADAKVYTVDIPDTLALGFGHSHLYHYLSEALAPQTSYYVKMKAENSNGVREMTGAAHKFTTTTADGTPAPFALVPPDNGIFNPREALRWKHSGGAFFYHLEVAEDIYFKNIILERPTITVPAYTMEDSILNSGGTYYWRVTATSRDRQKTTLNDGGAGSFTVSQNPTPPITKVLYAVDKGMTVLFEPVANAESYTVYYGTAPGKYTGHVDVAADKNSAFVPLKKSGRYYVTVTASRQGKESVPWNEVSGEI
ncbi:MAG: hypothetical protein LBD59_05425 [Prevotellaceae bacterium]|nr:hypothetical protein [Prevotellaceae bacterium]